VGEEKEVVYGEEEYIGDVEGETCDPDAYDP